MRKKTMVLVPFTHILLLGDNGSIWAVNYDTGYVQYRIGMDSTITLWKYSSGMIIMQTIHDIVVWNFRRKKKQQGELEYRRKLLKC